MAKRANVKKNNTLYAIGILMLLGISLFVILFASIQNKSLTFKTKAACAGCILKEKCLSLDETTQFGQNCYQCVMDNLKPKLKFCKNNNSIIVTKSKPRTKPRIITPTQFVSSPTLASSKTNSFYRITVKLICQNYNINQGNLLLKPAYAYWLKISSDKDTKKEFIPMNSQIINRDIILSDSKYFILQLFHGDNIRAYEQRYEGITLQQYDRMKYTNLPGTAPQISWDSKLPPDNYTITYQISDNFCKL